MVLEAPRVVIRRHLLQLQLRRLLLRLLRRLLLRLPHVLVDERGHEPLDEPLQQRLVRGVVPRRQVVRELVAERREPVGGAPVRWPDRGR